MKYLVKFTDSNVQNIILNICIFLFGINFLYKCNYIVMAAFVLLFIFKRFRIDLGNKITLITLLLFAISWYIFTDGHEIAGICLPICYLIGCNIDEKDENGIIKFILLISVSLALYTTLFFINNAIVNGITSYDVYNQPNIWTGRPLWATNIMLYSSLFFSCFGYVIFSEKDKKIRIIYLIIFVLNAFYALMLGRRAALLMIVLSLIISIIYKIIYSDINERKRIIKIISIVVAVGFIGFVMFCVAYLFNICGFEKFIKTTDLYPRFISNPNHEPIPMYYIKKFIGDSGRSILRREHLKHFTEFLWGGSKIKEIVGNYAHDIWLDCFDAAGIIAFIVIIIYSIFLIIKFINILKNKNVEIQFKILISCIFICMFVQFSIEPIMEACRAYAFGICMINGSLELIKKEGNNG